MIYSVYDVDSAYVVVFLIFFFNSTATPKIYTVGLTLSRHDALPILAVPVFGRDRPPRRDHQIVDDSRDRGRVVGVPSACRGARGRAGVSNRKSTRLNSSH